jgi:transposase
MRKLDFPFLIKEDIELLQKREKQQSIARLRSRVQFLRLLKTQEANSIKAAAQTVGVTPKCGYEWWNLYKEKNFSQYLKLNYKPRRARLSEEQQEQFAQRASEENGFASQAEAIKYLEDEFQISYTQSGICLLFQRLRIKAKVPRPENRRADKGEQNEYKKTLPRE